MKNLTRSYNNKIFFGVIGGIGEYFNVDPTILRLIFIVVTIFTAFVPLFIVYLLSIFILPKSVDYAKSSKPFYRNVWFYFFLLFCFLALSLPLLILLGFRTYSSSPKIVFYEEQAHRPDFVNLVPGSDSIKSYLTENILSTNQDGEVFSSYYQFGNSDDQIFIWAYVSEYYFEDGIIEQGGLISAPMALYYQESQILSHQAPRIGTAYFSADVQEIFPERYQEQVFYFLDHSFVELSKNNLKQAEYFFEIN